jgi:hypothetical protein
MTKPRARPPRVSRCSACWPSRIAKQVARRRFPWEGFDDLLRRPLHRRVGGHAEVDDAPAVVRQQEEAEQHLGAGSGHREEVDRHQVPHVAAKGGPHVGDGGLSRRGIHRSARFSEREVGSRSEHGPGGRDSSGATPKRFRPTVSTTTATTAWTTFMDGMLRMGMTPWLPPKTALKTSTMEPIWPVWSPRSRAGRAEPIDFSRLYCNDTQYLEVEGAFDDGSGRRTIRARSNRQDRATLRSADRTRRPLCCRHRLSRQFRREPLRSGAGARRREHAYPEGADAPAGVAAPLVS